MTDLPIPPRTRPRLWPFAAFVLIFLLGVAAGVGGSRLVLNRYQVFNHGSGMHMRDRWTGHIYYVSGGRATAVKFLRPASPDEEVPLDRTNNPFLDAVLREPR